MARVTVEDCLDNVDNRFQLVLVASKRARQVAMGKEPMVEWENDKPTVVALREISEGFVTNAILNEKETVVEEIVETEVKRALVLVLRPAPVPAMRLSILAPKHRF